MKKVALDFIQQTHNIEFAADQYYLGFHVPKATMVKHVHMHMLVGKLTMRGNIEFNRFLFSSVDYVIDHLK